MAYVSLLANVPALLKEWFPVLRRVYAQDFVGEMFQSLGRGSEEIPNKQAE